MARIVECVPNFSEGRRKNVIDAIADAIKSVDGVSFLDCESDASHNRSVMTFVGSPEAVLESAFLSVKKASELIDLNTHTGEHPRIGAADVVPFIPIEGVTVEECVAMANALAKRIAVELDIPVYLYEDAATREDRRNLANIRKGEYEKLKIEIETNPDRKPDYGAAKIHPTAGATVVGARFPLIAYNVYLNTDNLDIAKAIAKKVRWKDGGLPHVKALGLFIKEKNLVQVSMNLTNFEITGMHKAYEAVKEEAGKYGISIFSSEIVGLVPMRAIAQTAAHFLKLENFTTSQILENKITEAMKNDDS